jgi:excinuclease UvrABC helicase subunit UvrB
VALTTSIADARARDGADVLFDPGAASDAIAAAIEAEMLREAQALNFEKAASLRDRLDEIRMQLAATRSATPGRRKGRTPE